MLEKLESEMVLIQPPSQYPCYFQVKMDIYNIMLNLKAIIIALIFVFSEREGDYHTAAVQGTECFETRYPQTFGGTDGDTYF